MNSSQQIICANCGSTRLKDWCDLTDDEKFLVERLHRNADFSTEERKKHRFCIRCWFEDSGNVETNA